MKWDDNCSLLDYGSSYLPKNKQSHLYIEYNRGLAESTSSVFVPSILNS